MKPKRHAAWDIIAIVMRYIVIVEDGQTKDVEGSIYCTDLEATKLAFPDNFHIVSVRHLEPDAIDEEVDRGVVLIAGCVSITIDDFVLGDTRNFE